MTRQFTNLSIALMCFFCVAQEVRADLFSIDSVVTQDGGVQYSTFHSAENGRNGSTKAQILLGTPTGSGVNSWNTTTGAFEIHVRIYDGFNPNAAPTGDFVATAVGTGNLVVNGSNKISGSIDWTFTLVQENGAATPATADIVTIINSYNAQYGTSVISMDFLANESASNNFIPIDANNAKGELWGSDNPPNAAKAGIDLKFKLSKTTTTNIVPTPSTFILMGLGMAGLGATRLRKRKKVAAA